MHVKPGTLFQPDLRLFLLMGAAVVRDQMQRQIPGSFPVDLFEEPQPFHMRMPVFRAQRLALAFFIAAEHRGLFRRIETEPDHIPKRFFKTEIVGDFNGSGAVRLDLMDTPEPLNTAAGHSGGFGHAADAPVRPAFRRTVRGGNNLSGGIRRNGRLAPPSALILQRIDAALLMKPAAPL